MNSHQRKKDHKWKLALLREITSEMLTALEGIKDGEGTIDELIEELRYCKQFDPEA